MTKMFAALGVLFCMFTAACANSDRVQASDYMPVTRFDPSRDAAKDIADALEEAQRSGRRVLLDVGGDWCIWCHRLDEFFEENLAAAELLHENYVAVKVNYSPENENEEVLSRYPEITAYPHFFVLDSSGNVLCSQDTGELEEGDHHDREKMMKFLRRWAAKKPR